MTDKGAGQHKPAAKAVQPSKEQAQAQARQAWTYSLILACAVALAVTAAAYLGYQPFAVAFPTTIPAFIILFLAAPLAAIARMQTYKRHWVGQAVTPTGYLLGTRIYLTTLLVATFLSGLLLSLSPTPTLIGTVFYDLLAIGCVAIAYPHGEPMNTRLPDLGVERGKRLR
ncbi:hypothetical protein [Mucisphaera sp.]|uniref:hypothetical protein n=1 Tax=Mucisphaera sp. TaxID=2913024 RepID=UPI003D122693